MPKIKNLLFYRVFTVGTLLVMLFSQCKKNEVPAADGEDIVSPTTGTLREMTLDSILLYAKQVYLWNDAIPAYADFLPRAKYAALAGDVLAYRTELYDLSQLKLNAATGKAYEFPKIAGNPKYSYIIKGVAGSGSIADTQSAVVADPVLASSLIDVGGTKIAYIALSSFPRLATCKAALDDNFAGFSNDQPAYLVIDLRSNGGGYIETAEYVANLVAPSATGGKVMYTEHFNAQMQAGNAKILRHQPYLDANGKTQLYNGRLATMQDVDYSVKGNTYLFAKKGKLESVKQVWFIVSESTASASELLISALKPYLNVKLAGTQTYGKPVGFFGVGIGGYTVYMSGFLIKNAEGFSDYFNGMPVDLPVVQDGLYPLGNLQENCLAAVLSAIVKSKNLAVGKTSVITLSGTTSKQLNTVGAPEMIEQRLQLK